MQVIYRHIINVDFGPNKTLVEVIKGGVFGGTYFRDIFYGINDKWYKTLWKEFDELVRRFIVQIIMMLVLINIVLIGEHH